MWNFNLFVPVYNIKPENEIKIKVFDYLKEIFLKRLSIEKEAQSQARYKSTVKEYSNL